MDQRLFVAARLGDIATLELLLREDPLLLDRLSLSSQENPLHVAAFAGQADFAAKILSLKPELALEPNQQGFSPLHIASASGEIEVVRELLRVKNPDVMCLLKDRDGLIPLHWAAQRGRIDVIKELVLSFPNSLKVESASLDTPLHVAVRNNQVEATKLLLEEIKDHNMVQDVVNRQNREGNTVLHLATLGKQLQIVEMLIGEEAIIRGSVDADRQNRNWLTPKDILDVVIETEGGNVSEMYKPPGGFKTEDANGNNNTTKQKREMEKMNPLMEAARKGDIDFLLRSTETDPSLLEVIVLNGEESPLHVASMYGHLSFVKEMLKISENLGRELNKDGFTPLHIAAAMGHIEIVRELLEKLSGEICLIKGKERKIPLHYAVMRGRVCVLDELVSANPDSIEEVTARGETVFHLAVRYCQFDGFVGLLERLKEFDKLCVLNKQDNGGNTVLHLAVKKRQYEILNKKVIDLLLGSRGYNDTIHKDFIEVNSINSNGFTPLDLLLYIGGEPEDAEIHQILREAGAI
ncbi:hypothetical protein AALP_AA4G236100 [Arabis alpina]|uniref:Uncharacterized protein n=1 Tax=Arabis alpina TaxID=50452 RepID=A0A087H574_ARAAL|nr:hypothetical protein AALP_AA4G236100 [Arabis alpina]